MSGLLRYIRYTGIALAIAVGLTILSVVASPLLGNQLGGVFSPASAFAGETSGGGG